MRYLVSFLFTALYLLFPSPLFSEENLILSRRQSDFLEIQGAELEALLGKALEHLELLAVRNGVLIPIPFQVDERVAREDGRYEWALPLGPKGGQVTDDGLLDADDELVFMAKDLGTQAGPEDLMKVTPPVIEISVTDPLTGKNAFAYLGAASMIPRRSDEDYADLEPEKDYVETSVYKIGHSPDFPIAHNENVLKKEAGGTGVDFVDLHKQRLILSMFFGTLKFVKTGEDWTSEISAYKDGPVRVIRRNENRLFIVASIKSPALYTTTFYLRDTFWYPAEISAPFKLSTIFTSLKIYQATEFCREATGMQLFSNSISRGILIDGVMSQEEKNVLEASEQINQEWQLVAGQQGTWINRVTFGPGLAKAKHGLHYLDDAETEDPPEEEPGIYGKVGFVLTNLENLEGGAYSFRSYVHLPEHFEPGDEKRILNMLDHPLQVETHTI